ncbi:MAG: 2Fe-2S iron-sulfur cluster-binding protein [Thiothrix sp.]
MGSMTPYPVLSALKHFPADFGNFYPQPFHKGEGDIIMVEVTFTLDGQTITAQAGMSILQAAVVSAGVRIPRLCASEQLESLVPCVVFGAD